MDKTTSEAQAELQSAVALLATSTRGDLTEAGLSFPAAPWIRALRRAHHDVGNGVRAADLVPLLSVFRRALEDINTLWSGATSRSIQALNALDAALTRYTRDERKGLRRDQPSTRVHTFHLGPLHFKPLTLTNNDAANLLGSLVFFLSHGVGEQIHATATGQEEPAGQSDVMRQIRSTSNVVSQDQELLRKRFRLDEGAPYPRKTYGKFKSGPWIAKLLKVADPNDKKQRSASEMATLLRTAVAMAREINTLFPGAAEYSIVALGQAERVMTRADARSRHVYDLHRMNLATSQTQYDAPNLMAGVAQSLKQVVPDSVETPMRSSKEAAEAVQKAGVTLRTEADALRKRLDAMPKDERGFIKEAAGTLTASAAIGRASTLIAAVRAEVAHSDNAHGDADKRVLWSSDGLTARLSNMTGLVKQLHPDIVIDAAPLRLSTRAGYHRLSTLDKASEAVRLMQAAEVALRGQRVHAGVKGNLQSCLGVEDAVSKRASGLREATGTLAVADAIDRAAELVAAALKTAIRQPMNTKVMQRGIDVASNLRRLAAETRKETEVPVVLKPSHGTTRANARDADPADQAAEAERLMQAAETALRGERALHLSAQRCLRSVRDLDDAFRKRAYALEKSAENEPQSWGESTLHERENAFDSGPLLKKILKMFDSHIPMSKGATMFSPAQAAAVISAVADGVHEVSMLAIRGNDAARTVSSELRGEWMALRMLATETKRSRAQWVPISGSIFERVPASERRGWKGAARFLVVAADLLKELGESKAERDIRGFSVAVARGGMNESSSLLREAMQRLRIDAARVGP